MSRDAKYTTVNDCVVVDIRKYSDNRGYLSVIEGETETCLLSVFGSRGCAWCTCSQDITAVYGRYQWFCTCDHGRWRKQENVCIRSSMERFIGGTGALAYIG